MVIYISEKYEWWLKTNPKEEHIMFVAMLHLLHAQFNDFRWIELSNEDVNHIVKEDNNVRNGFDIVNQEIPIVKVIHEYLDTNESLYQLDIIGIKKVNLKLQNNIGYKIKKEGNIAKWAYLLGRLADVLNESRTEVMDTEVSLPMVDKKTNQVLEEQRYFTAIPVIYRYQLTRQYDNWLKVRKAAKTYTDRVEY